QSIERRHRLNIYSIAIRRWKSGERAEKSQQPLNHERHIHFVMLSECRADLHITATGGPAWHHEAVLLVVFLVVRVNQSLKNYAEQLRNV
ncbi:hypothetical protein, partial [Marivita sp.]|uniref:hypothetical protein n=1 Tax=Marivita sp. TaxID=2003365 RepID=UPI0025C3F93C